MPELLPIEKLVDEERLPGYNFRNYYPANPGDVLDDKYRLVSKLGWGSDSTVWLAEVICEGNYSTRRSYVVVKLCNCSIPEPERLAEANSNFHLATAAPEHQGCGALGTAFEAFEVMSPRGQTHVALVFEPLREPLWLFERRLSNGHSAFQTNRLPLIKAYIQILLEDLKLDNIMLTFENQSTIEAYVDKQGAYPMARKVYDDHVIYQCHNDFGPISEGLGKMIPKITDFGLAHHCNVPVLLYPIQRDEYRAPEVLLGLGWSFSADIWNFGLVIWELVTGKSLFSTLDAPYNTAQHLADMIAILGDVPPDIVRRERNMRYHRWGFEAHNAAGKLCDNATDFYSGPFFDDKGNFMHNHLIPWSRNLESEVLEFPRGDSGEAELFLSFIRRMLRWIPQDRATAEELVNDPWLGSCGWR
ncbi:hypothetical protein E4U50_000310 [Claviceps purpurea]|nr:hypothetical protein E4U50_000310 [Claviceps purpurea]